MNSDLRRFLSILLALACVPAFSASVLSADDAALNAAREDEARRIALVARLSKTVVAIFPATPEDGQQPTTPQGSGSGVIIDKDGHALTNYHVVGEANSFNVGLSDGKVYSAVICGRDPTGDTAVIKIEGAPGGFAELGDSDKLEVGQWVLAMGNPFGLATDFMPTVTQGVISGLHRYLPGTMGGDLIYTDCIQIDVSINPGNSGGPLFDTNGKLIGINGRMSSSRTRDRVNSGVGFAIPINQIKGFLPDLVAGKRVHHAVLGVGLSEGQEDVSITSILSGSAADKAGLKVGDIVRNFQGREIESEDELKNRIGVLPAGTRVRMVIERDKRKYDIEVSLDQRPTGAEAADAGEEEPAPEKPSTGPKVDLPEGLSAQGVAERYAKAVGGYQALGKIADTVTRGHVRRLIANRAWVDGTITQYDIGSCKLRHETEYTYRGNKLQQIIAFDGEAGWSFVNGQVTDLKPEDVNAVKKELRAFDLLTRPDGWKENADLGGAEQLAGKALVVVVTRDEDAQERRWSFDPETWYLVRYVRKATGSGDTMDDRIGDYRPVGDVLQPFHYERYSNGIRQEVIQVDSIEINRGVDLKILQDRPAAKVGPKVY